MLVNPLYPAESKGRSKQGQKREQRRNKETDLETSGVEQRNLFFRHAFQIKSERSGNFLTGRPVNCISPSQ